MPHVIPIGTSEPQDFGLFDDRAPIVGTGWSVALEITARDGAVIATPPTVAWLNQAAGTVRVTGTEALPLGNYSVRFRLTDLSSKVGFAPNGHAPLLWVVVPVP